ncbi:MAG: anaerobic ribonucleoside-triphosphate reductase activating protein [Muribaculaceae bacterium]
MRNELSVLKIVHGTSVDGVGLRSSIYFAGCSHHCEGCHNPESWDINNGKLMTIEDILLEIEENDFNVTFSGGDPLMQIDGVTQLAKMIKSRLGKTIWCYTGYTWAEIQENIKYMKLMQYVDVLVDSPFMLSLRDTDLPFRGSSNQRIIELAK